MRYLFLFLFVSCNNYKADTIQVDESSIIDSLLSAGDSTNAALRSLDTLAVNSIAEVQATIEKLKSEKQVIQTQLDREVRYITIEKSDTSKDRLIANLRTQLSRYETEIARLKKQPEKIDQIPNEVEVEKPDEKSLIVTLDRKIRGGGEISFSKIDVYIAPYSKRIERRFKTPELSCDLMYINSIRGKRANFYEGQYFFNDLTPGKYILKICSYYGGYTVIEKNGKQQTVEMRASQTQ